MFNLKLPRRLSIAGRFSLMAVVALCFAAFCIGMALWSARDLMIERKRTEIRNTVEAGATVLRGYVERAKAGTLKPEEAKRLAIDAVRASRFDGGNYYFIYDYDGVNVMHPVRKELEGKSLIGLKDPAGTFLIADMVKVAKGPGEGFTEYLWVKPGDKEHTLKVGYTVGIPEWGWLIGSGLHVYDVDQRFLAEARRLALLLAPFALGFVVVALVIGRSVSRPLRALTGSMGRLAGGDLEARIEGADRRDEVGDIAKAVQAFRDRLRERASEERRRELDAAQEAERAKKAMLASVAAEFEARVKSTADRVLQGAEGMRRTATEMADGADAARARAVETREAGHSTQEAVGQMAASADELASAISAIAREVSEGLTLSRGAVDKVRSTQAVIASLSAASAEIGNVVRLIQDIAEQTNLLALNATIEAARAGEAGKGFAVVANEVKTLAGQTSKATDDISARIAAIQAATGDAVRAVEDVGATIVQMNGISTSISSAVEQQATATGVIERSTGLASSLTHRVSGALDDLGAVAGSTRDRALDVSDSAQRLADEARVLDAEMVRFMNQLRAA